MALTRDQWFAKIQHWVPGWWFEERHYQGALLYAFCAVLEGIQQDVDDQIAQTYIGDSAAPILDLHGEERNVLRVTGEPDPFYSVRVRNLVNKSNAPAIKKLVDALLLEGECRVIEHGTDIAFLNRGAFGSRRDLFNDRRYMNYFSVVIPKQIAVSNSFCNGAYGSRGNYLGTAGELPLDVLLNIIVTTINNAKAAGVLYRLVELAQ